jgi:uncharacterized membrane protein
VPLLFIGCMFIFATRGYMSTEFGLITIGLSLPFMIWTVFAMRSRIRKGREAGEDSTRFMKSLQIGLVIMLGAIVFVIVVRAIASPGGLYVIPAGMFLTGAVMFIRAMSPPG